MRLHQVCLKTSEFYIELPSANAGDKGDSSIPRLGRSPRRGNGSPLQYSCLEISIDGIVHGVAKSRTRLSDWTELN